MSARPPVTLSASDHDELVGAALAALLEAPRTAGALLEEVDRARVVPDEDLPSEVARLGSWVDFIDASGRARRAQLVLPEGGDALSVLSPAGAALIGLRAGDVIRWPDRLGGEDAITLLRVIQP